MQDNNQHPAYEVFKLKTLLADACVEISTWKIKFQEEQKETEKLRKQLAEARKQIIKLPIGGTVK